MKHSVDLHLIRRSFLPNDDLVLEWDKVHEEKGKLPKFKCLWLGQFHISGKLIPSNYIF